MDGTSFEKRRLSRAKSLNVLVGDRDTNFADLQLSYFSDKKQLHAKHRCHLQNHGQGQHHVD